MCFAERVPRERHWSTTPSYLFGEASACLRKRLEKCLSLIRSLTAVLICVIPGSASDLVERYENLLLLHASDYRSVAVARAVFQASLLDMFHRSVSMARESRYDHEGEFAYFINWSRNDTASTAEKQAHEKRNATFRRLFIDTIPKLAYAYRIPGFDQSTNPYYKKPEILQLYISALEYCYSRGLTEDAWLPDHAGNKSAKALQQGLIRKAGDFSTVSQRLSGFIQSIFLMREPLADFGLLAKYRAVVRNLVVNNGVMYPAFAHLARGEVRVARVNPLPIGQQYDLDADGIRHFVDYFWPFFLLIEDSQERSMMASILSKVIARNAAVKPGLRGIIKPDGTGFHHGTAYVGGYSPFAIEALAQLLYLTKPSGLWHAANVDAVKQAVEAYRVMVQKYSTSAALRGRFVRSSGAGRTAAISKAMVFLAHPDGMDDFDMKARVAEFLDVETLLREGQQIRYHMGARGLPIRGLGILRLIADLQRLDVTAAEPPSGVWIKPYAAAGFFRRANWLVIAKGFSQYFWDYEGTVGNGQNSFGQNWSNGLLQVFSAGDPISERGSGHVLDAGWDWYHVPGTTASHYPIEKRSSRAVRELRRERGIVQRSIDRNYSTKSFVGGVSLGDYGFFVQDLEAVPFTAPTNLRARKSYFCVSDWILALGSHISGGTREDETHTTIFQTRLETADTATWVNGERVVGLDVESRHAGGSPVTLIDSVGNSYFLAASTAELVLSRKLQQSMSGNYKPNEGAYAQAFLNHGLQPLEQGYQYVVIPADHTGQKIEELAANPDAYFRVVETNAMHLVHFPQKRLTAYGFYETVEAPSDTIVKSVDQPAAVITCEHDATLRLAASVPNIGWQFDETIKSRGHSYASKQFAQQQAKLHSLELVLRGNWCMQVPAQGIWTESRGDETTVQLQVSDGMSTEITLVQCEPSP